MTLVGEDGSMLIPDPKGLDRPDEIEIGKNYRIIKGLGEGEVGECIAKKESAFGHAWGTIKTDSGEYPTRYQLLEHAEVESE